MEWAADQLAKRFRHVIVRAIYTNYTSGQDLRIRFRADDLKCENIFFDRTSSQRKRWQERGGILICWQNDSNRPLEGEHDAVLFAECPPRIDAIYRFTNGATRACAVVYEPVSWVPHDTIVRSRHHEHPYKLARSLERLGIVRAFVERSPTLTPMNLDRLCARLEASRWLSAHESPASAARSADTNR